MSDLGLLGRGDIELEIGRVLESCLEQREHFCSALARGADDERKAEALAVGAVPVTERVQRGFARRKRAALLGLRPFRRLCESCPQFVEIRAYFRVMAESFAVVVRPELRPDFHGCGVQG